MAGEFWVYDDLRVYSRELTRKEILDLMLGETAIKFRAKDWETVFCNIGEVSPRMKIRSKIYMPLSETEKAKLKPEQQEENYDGFIYEVDPSEREIYSYLGYSHDAGFYDSDHINKEVYFYGNPEGLVKLLTKNGFCLIEAD
jgi:hypothetical protein